MSGILMTIKLSNFWWSSKFKVKFWPPLYIRQQPRNWKLLIHNQSWVSKDKCEFFLHIMLYIEINNDNSWISLHLSRVIYYYEWKVRMEITSFVCWGGLPQCNQCCLLLLVTLGKINQSSKQVPRKSENKKIIVHVHHNSIVWPQQMTKIFFFLVLVSFLCNYYYRKQVYKRN